MAETRPTIQLEGLTNLPHHLRNASCLYEHAYLAVQPVRQPIETLCRLGGREGPEAAVRQPLSKRAWVQRGWARWKTSRAPDVGRGKA
jgi:hypothetical protein